MGLDMYAYTTKAKLKREVDFDTINLDEDDLHYWRKHPNLHGWMQELYETKGGDSPDFNGDTLVLTEKDLDELEYAIQNNNLPQTSGFFFGNSSGDEIEDDMEFIKNAREAIKEGKTVYYTSSW